MRTFLYQAFLIPRRFVVIVCILCDDAYTLPDDESNKVVFLETCICLNISEVNEGFLLRKHTF